MSTDTARWDDAGFVRSSSYRTATLDRLGTSPATPSTIAEDTDVDIAHVSRALQELRERDLVELLVSEDVRKGRIYGLTDAGRETRQALSELGGGEGE